MSLVVLFRSHVCNNEAEEQIFMYKSLPTDTVRENIKLTDLYMIDKDKTMEKTHRYLPRWRTASGGKDACFCCSVKKEPVLFFVLLLL
jgi:hypothetical protein